MELLASRTLHEKVPSLLALLHAAKDFTESTYRRCTWYLLHHSPTISYISGSFLAHGRVYDPQKEASAGGGRGVDHTQENQISVGDIKLYYDARTNRGSTSPLTPPPSRHTGSLPSHLRRLLNLHASIEQALLSALSTASTGITTSPSKAATKTGSKGQMLNLINHLGLEAVIQSVITVEDLSRLVWLWEWDGVTLPAHSKTPRTAVEELEEDNPFVVPSKDWTRGGMGLIIAPTTHYSRVVGKRVPAYGIGIQVETTMGKQGSMSSVARWTASSGDRRAAMTSRLAKWTQMCSDNTEISEVPYASIPALPKSITTPPASPSSRGKSSDIFTRPETPETAKSHSIVPDTPSLRRTAPSGRVRPNMKTSSLPPHLLRLWNLHTSVEQALSIALATASTGLMTSPSKAPVKDGANSSTGKMINLINHLGLEGLGHSVRCTVDDLSRLVWLWEWDGEVFPEHPRSVGSAVEDLEGGNPFIVTSKDWTRGGMGLILTPTTHFSRALGKRVPAYGIGIQVDSLKGGMSSIARWTASSEDRRAEIASRLARWVQVYSERRNRNPPSTPTATPNIPFASLPALGPSIAAQRPSSTSPIKFPSSKAKLDDPFVRPHTPETPHQQPDAPPVTPSSSSRRAALFERVRLKSLTTPSKSAKGSIEITVRSADGKESIREIGASEIKRRCLLGRLGGVAEAVWMSVVFVSDLLFGSAES